MELNVPHSEVMKKPKLSYTISDKKGYRNVKMLNSKKYSRIFLVSYFGILYNVYIKAKR